MEELVLFHMSGPQTGKARLPNWVRVLCIAAALVRGATTAEKLRGTKVWVSTPGRLLEIGWGWVWEGVAPSRCGGPGVSPPEIFLKTQMLNPAFWWLLRSVVDSGGRAFSSKQFKHVKG